MTSRTETVLSDLRNSQRYGAALQALIHRYSKNRCAISVDFRELVRHVRLPDRATHLLHPYPAKLLTHIPVFFLSDTVLCGHDDVVLDPFCGSGTTLLEAQLSGREALGVDSNPFARLLTRVKTTPLAVEWVRRETDSLLRRLRKKPLESPPDVVNLNYWFYPHVVRQLECLREAINGTPNRAVRDFFRINLAACARFVSLADPRLSVPVRLQSGQYSEDHPFYERTEKRLRVLKRINVCRSFQEILTRNIQRLSNYCSLVPPSTPVRIIGNDARALNSTSHGEQPLSAGVKHESVQLVLTSPPYPGAQKYIRSSTFALGWLGLCSQDNFRKHKLTTIGREEFSSKQCSVLPVTGIPPADVVLKQIAAINRTRATICATYINEMRTALREIYYVLRRGGYLIMVAANNNAVGIEFKTTEYLQWLADDTGFEVVLRLVDTIRSRGLMTKRNKTAGMIAREWVFLFRKS